MGEGTAEESSEILSMLENGEGGDGDGGFYRRVASFLLPFGDLISIDSHFPIPAIANRGFAAPKKKKNASTEVTVLRPLAKRFLPFLSRALKILPCSLRKCPREEANWAGELLAVYRVILDCLWCVSPCLAGKPFSVHLQRCSLLCCLETWGRFSEAEEEGFALLESLGSIVSPAAPVKSQKGRRTKVASSGRLLPDSTAKDARDAELAILVVEVVASLMRCTYKSKRKSDALYRRILLMANEVHPWLRFLDSEAYKKYHSSLVNALFKCSLFLAGECISFGPELVHNFCLEMSREWLTSSSRDQFAKIARQICSSISVHWDGRLGLMLEMLKCLLDSMACKCKDNIVEYTNEFLEFVHYVTDSLLTSSSSIQRVAYELLSKMRSDLQEVSLSVACILGFYAIGLAFRGTNHFQCREAISHSSNDDTHYLQIFGDSLGILVHNFHSNNEDLSDDLARCLDNFSSLQLEQKVSGLCGCVHGDVSFFSYLDALGFLCNQLDDYVTKTWKDMMSEGMMLHSTDINYILDAFHQFCVLFLSKVNEKSVKERLFESRLVLFHAVVASLKFSFLTSKDCQKIVTLIKNVIMCKWIKAQELKYLVSSFYNIGASLYNAGQVEKASIALHLCCTTSWVHIKLLSQVLQNDAMIVENDKSCKSTIRDATVDACAKSAVALDVIYKCGNVNLHDIVVDCLLSWSIIEDSLEMSSNPFALVKQWVKIVCRDFKDFDEEDSLPILSLLLQNKSTTLSTRVFGIILEQELLAYEESSAKYPNLFLKMQPRLLDMLLKEVYVGEKHVLQRSKILVKKGRALKTCGVDGLRNSFQCFSDAISLLEIACGDASGGNSQLYYQLALVYFLRAHCAQEVNGNEDVILKDITSALSWWSRMPEYIHDFDYEYTIQLFCSISDLLALKGHLRFQLEMCRLIALLCKRNNVPLEGCVNMLWSNRRLSHWCCSSPIDEIFIGNSSKDFGVSTNSITFWTNCMKSCHSSLVGFLQAFSLPNTILASENTLHSNITVEEIKRSVSALVSNESLTSDSAFEAGYILFGLSESLLHEGHMLEALSHAREALRLRKRVLQRKFVSLRHHPGKIDTIWSNEHLFTEAVGLIVTEDWPKFTKHSLLEKSSITPWSALRCYLQSIFQVGIIYESIGNGAEAEILFRLGKTISLSLSFPIFGITFSSHLGQVYRKKQLLNLAEKELDIARTILAENTANISCKHCESVLGSLVGLQAGDLLRSKFESTTGVKSIKSLSDALTEYKSAIEKLNLLHVGETIGSSYRKGFTSEATKVVVDNDLTDSSLMNVGDKRETRSMPKRPSRKKASGVDSNLSQNLGSDRNLDISVHKPTRPTRPQNLKAMEGCNESFHKFFLENATESNLMKDIMLVKWECHKRLLSLRLLSKIGKCMRINSGNHKVHEIFWHSMSLLFDFGQIAFDDVRFLEFVGMEKSNEAFPVQRAILLYEMSLFCVKDCFSEGSRIKCCTLSKPQIPTVLSWLLTAFIIVQDIPLLFQKICRSVAAIISLSMSTGHFSLPFSFESLTETHLATFFHQASIGTNLQHLYISNFKDPDAKSKDLSNGGSPAHARTLERLSDLEKFINAFFNSLPNFTVVCISLLGGEYINLLGETLLLPSFYPAWMLLSRLNRNGPPIVMLLPVDFIPEDDSNVCQTASLNMEEIAKWECPWGPTLVDYVAPQYKVILEENYMSLSQTSCDSSDTQRNRFMWWSERSRVNKQLDMFLRRMEDSWLGPWRCLLLAERSYFKNLDTVLVKLKRVLESECGLDVNFPFLRTVIGGSQSVCDVEACISQMVQYKGYLGRGMCCGAESFRVFSSAVGGGAAISESICSLIHEVFNSIVQEHVEREPIVLVLDSDLQMLPWESLPILRNEEVYRMPSMSSISLTLSKNNQHVESKTLGSFIPSVDPLDAYYLLNPSGDLSSTQMEFEDWFRSQNWEGKAGNVPAIEELLEALQNHDLFLYFGHGSGMQYVPGNAIQRLNQCAATLLMGCSSGSLSLRGNYAPQGAPLSYLLAGSPVVIANLWEVSDKDIDRFGKSMLTSWLQEPTTSDSNMSEPGGVRKTRNRALMKDSCGDISKNSSRRIASFMSQARDACKLPQLIGAAPVCYGVPTLIKRNQKR